MKIGTLEFKWSVSRGRDSYGYNICTLFFDGEKVARCNGGGYDMKGTCLGNFIASRFADRLLKLKEKDLPKAGGCRPEGTRPEFYGLSYIDPTYDPGKAVVKHAPVFGKDEDAGKTVAVLEKEGKSLGLERYQAFWSATSKFPTRKHRIPSIDGACGMSSVQEIMRAIKLDIEYVPTKGGNSIYLLHDHKRSRK